MTDHTVQWYVDDRSEGRFRLNSDTMLRAYDVRGLIMELHEYFGFGGVSNRAFRMIIGSDIGDFATFVESWEYFVENDHRWFYDFDSWSIDFKNETDMFYFKLLKKS